MGSKRCQFERCRHPARPGGWRYCSLHIGVMYRRMLDDGYLEPWPDGEEPGCPQDLICFKEAEEISQEVVDAVYG